jgi:hypothetical protein
MRNKDIKPTEPYPKILWYSIKRQPPTEEEKKAIYNRYYQAAINKFNRNFVHAQIDQVDLLAREQAERMTEAEINNPTQLKKVVANNFVQHQSLIETIETSDDFVEWYEK